jgi:AcrR family transcriptional regulator
VSQGILHHYFRDKAAMLAAATRRVTADLDRRVATESRGARTARERLRAVIRTCLRTAVDNRDFWTVFIEFWGEAFHERRLAAVNRQAYARAPPVSPIPAGLQSADPTARRWDDLRGELRRRHTEVLDVLAKAPDRMTEVRAPIIMVANTRQPDGTVTPMQWVEECDWKACAIIFRLHELDHLGQARRALRGLAD